MNNQPQTLIRRSQVERRTGLACSSIYARIATGEFPKPVPLGGRNVAWVESEVDAWINERIQLRDEA